MNSGCRKTRVAGAPRSAWKLTSQCPSREASSVSRTAGTVCEAVFVASRKTTKTVPQGSSLSGTVRVALGRGVGDRLGFARLRIPELRHLARDAEACVDACRVIAAVVDEVDVAITQLAMNKQEPSVCVRPGVVEVRLEVQSTKDVVQALTSIDRALTNLMHARPVPEQIFAELCKLGMVVSQTGIVIGSWPRESRAAFNQLVNGTKHG